MKNKIKLPQWVFDNLDAYDNCALPNECNDMDRQELKAYLEKKVGAKVKIKECVFLHCEEITITKNKRKTPYLVAEIIYE